MFRVYGLGFIPKPSARGEDEVDVETSTNTFVVSPDLRSPIRP